MPNAPGRRALPAALVQSLHGAQPTAVVLIDGPSGAGKSTLADDLIAAWPTKTQPTLVRLDDIYPGWQGLDAAIMHLHAQVLAPRSAGQLARWQRYDWGRGEPAEWHTVEPDHPLIVEGCGALARAHAALSDIRVWIDADDTVRKHRALERDGEAYRPFWNQWQAQWESYVQREHPQQHATVRLHSADELPRQRGHREAAGEC